jgi:hypothetical protein
VKQSFLLTAEARRRRGIVNSELWILKNVAPTLRSAHADLKVSATRASSERASAKKPINQVQVFALLAGGVPSHRVAILVKDGGIGYEKSPQSGLHLLCLARSLL